jgi:amino acid adenylation domain-containing protein
MSAMNGKTHGSHPFFPCARPLGVHHRPDRPSKESRPVKLILETPTTLADGPDEGFIAPTVPDLVHELALARPDALAVEDSESKLSYGDLDRRSTAVARLLRTHAVEREVVVGIYLPRSSGLVAAALGILKAGGAYLPLDPQYPADRIAFMLQDSGAPVVLTSEALADQLPSGPWQAIVLASVPPLQGTELPPPPARPALNDLAYVVYTSGSTGRPKGVEIPHRALLNMCSWHRDAFDIGAGDRATQAYSPAFDPAANELWPYLTAGASIHVPSEETRLSPELMRDWVVEKAITNAFLPTVLAEAALRQRWPAGAALRYLHTGGDVLHRFAPADLPFELINNYGPAENTVVTTSGVVPKGGSEDGLPSIGRVIPGVYVVVLDPELRPVPEGEVGELFVGGASLARGYRNRPELTSERFIDYPLDAHPGARLYRTGDLVRLRSDGEIEFGGRLDNQVKIRGARVELDEVVAVLERHPGVRSAVATATGEAAERRINAYLVPFQEAPPAAAELRSFLEQRLPEFMIPATFTPIRELPLTVNGKLDRDALPEPQLMTPEDGMAPPRTPVEERMVEIVSNLLDLERVGVEQDFFLLGGHSLLATQIIARVREDYGVEVPLRDVFKARTIEGISTLIEGLLIARLETMTDEEAERLLR